MFAIDHLAFPCFDVPATVEFYTSVLGGSLRHAQSGPAPTWNAKEYLLLAFELPGGVVVDFFSFDGIRRPTGSALPKDIWHIALSVATRQDVMRLKARFEASAVPLWQETHDIDDVHVYATDPNGVTIEVLATQDGIRSRKNDPERARGVLERWVAERK